jgi:agmatine/peptidylarginine deiminase
MAAALNPTLIGLFVAFGGPQSSPAPSPVAGEIPPIAVFDHPAELERRLVADWEASGPTLMVFTETWSSTLTEVASLLEDDETLILAREGITPRREAEQWRRGLPRAVQERVSLVNLSLDTPWIRDYGPLQVETSDGVLWLDTRYLSGRPADDRAPRTIARLYGRDVDRVDFRLEGGSIVSNGHGFCVATFEYAHDHALLRELDDEAQRLHFLGQIGCSTMVLVPALRNENTRHVDMFVHFTGSDTVLIGDIDTAEDPEDALRLELATLAIAEAARTRGLALDIHRVPFGKIDAEIYYTYLNVLPIGRHLLVPSYRSVPRDRERYALATIREAAPDREIVAIHADDMIELEGALHCAALNLFRSEQAVHSRAMAGINFDPW